MKEFAKKVIFPVATAILLIVVFYPFCIREGECDYLKLWLLVGMPFGICRMFLWIVPKGFDIGGTVGVVALNFLAGGVIGGLVLAWRLLDAAGYFIKTVFRYIACLVKR